MTFSAAGATLAKAETECLGPAVWVATAMVSCSGAGWGPLVDAGVNDAVVPPHAVSRNAIDARCAFTL